MLNQIATGLFSDSLPYGAFEILHKWSGMVLAAAAVLHAILNWNWIKANYLRRGIRA